MRKLINSAAKVLGGSVIAVIVVFLIGDIETTYAAPRFENKCSDGVDNDGDGLIDADDPDCGGGSGGGGDSGGKGGGSAIRLCADFNDPLVTLNEVNYILDDDGGQYCDGSDGEMLIDAGLKFSTTTRNKNDRTVIVDFQGGNCGNVRDADFGMWTFFGQLDTFFANATSSEYVAPEGCNPGNPYATPYNPDSLACLTDTGVQLPVGDIRQGETKFMSMRVNLTEPGKSPKNSSTALVMTFAERLGPNLCDIGAAALPVAIACIAEESESCTEWRLRAFRACVFDYSTDQGGSWEFAANGCPVSTDVTFTVKP